MITNKHKQPMLYTYYVNTLLFLRIMLSIGKLFIYNISSTTQYTILSSIDVCVVASGEQLSNNQP